MHATAQLAFGAYTVTGENRQLLEIEILLLELRKVESILAVYSERFRNAQAEKDDETSVYNALTAYLDKNLHYIVDFLQMRKGGSVSKWRMEWHGMELILFIFSECTSVNFGRFEILFTMAWERLRIVNELYDWYFF